MCRHHDEVTRVGSVEGNEAPVGAGLDIQYCFHCALWTRSVEGTEITRLSPDAGVVGLLAVPRPKARIVECREEGKSSVMRTIFKAL